MSIDETNRTVARRTESLTQRDIAPELRLATNVVLFATRLTHIRRVQMNFRDFQTHAKLATREYT